MVCKVTPIEGVTFYLAMSEEKKYEKLDKEVTLDKKSSGIEDVDVKGTKSKRVASRFFNAVLAVAFFVVFLMSLMSFSASSNNYRVIAGTGPGESGKACVLNAEFNSETSVNTGVPGSDGACRFTIGGEVILAVYAGLSIAVMIIKIIGGWSM